MTDEGRVTQKQFAEMFGISTRTVFNLREAGLSEHCVSKGRDVLIRMPEGAQWYVRYREAEAAAREAPTSLQQLDLEHAQMRNEERRLDLRRKKEELIEVAAVELWAADMIARLASRLDALPLRIAQGVNAGKLAERRKQAEVLVAEVREELRLTPIRAQEDAA